MDLETIKRYDDSWWLEYLKQKTVFDTENIKAQKNWLIEQAEKAQNLEGINKRLEKKNEMILGWNTEHVLEIQELKAQNEHIKNEFRKLELMHWQALNKLKKLSE